MSTLRVTLRCLKHPATLASIALLLANDHWLKANYPSWWTGKLSDFAGLFFFPFLLAALLGLLLDRQNVSPRTTGGLVFGFTALWFASFKTLPPVNAATCTLLGFLLGHPVQLVLDPTDLIALPVLVPAWRLWTRHVAIPDGEPGRRAWVALALGALATVATSPTPPMAIVQSLDKQGGKVYAYGAGLYYSSSSPVHGLASSDDGGRHWSTVSSSSVIPASSRQPVDEACDPLNPQVCYRIAPEQVLASTDGGKTYQVVWSIPWGRRFFMERLNWARGLAGEKHIDMGPKDFVFAPPVGANGLSTAVFAMGNEGALVRTPEGSWERVAVGTAQPTQFTATDWYDPFRAAPVETDIASGLVLGIFSLLSFRAAAVFKRMGTSTHSVAGAIWPVVVIDLLFLIGWIAWALLLYHFGPYTVFGLAILSGIAGPLALLPLLGIILLLVWAWTRIVRLPRTAGIAAGAFWRTLLITIGMAMATWGVLILWSVGIIPLYEIAIGIGIVFAVVLVIVGIKSVPGTQPVR